jgi:hypothetical protein
MGNFVASYQTKEMSRIKYAVARALGCSSREAGRIRYFTNPSFIRYLYYFKVKGNEKICSKTVNENAKNQT